MSAVLGILGVTTLGFYVDGAIAELRLDMAVMLITATGAVPMAMDALSRALRRRRIDDGPARLNATEAAACA